MRFIPITSVCLSLFAQGAYAHETWLEPRNYQITSGQTLEADIRNGEGFSGFRLAYMPAKQQRLDLVIDRNVLPVDGRLGDIPAVSMMPSEDGLAVLAYVSTQNKLNYTEAEKFRNFCTHKDFPEVLEQHEARGLPETGFSEGYTRFSKALVAVGDAQGADSNLGMEIELVARDNPYQPDFDGVMDVELYYQGALRPDAQIEIFERAPDGTVKITTTRTDENGIGAVPVKPEHVYLLDSVVMREPDAATAEANGIVWESLWAALTFTVR
ncbi:DUF4198 domain-containing protein [Donghicola sp. XS_ASV15]|uniref:DUF4198 domain-containing protein n=1 Tax=Donghicola sp. XS_ASV15 TaxID=3241295 RepID=UPI003514D04C